jgi:RNA polymerase sigma factor (sigma-70 family)
MVRTGAFGRRGGNPAAPIGQHGVMHPIGSDAEIIAASLSDPPVFGNVFDRHFAAIHRYVRRRVGIELADDLASETFVQAFRSRSTFATTEEDARAWLFGIASNLLRHHYRTDRRRLLAYARAGAVAQRDADPDGVEDRLDAQAAGPLVARALASLRAQERDVLLLFAWAGLSYEEISEALKIPIGTVRSRLSRARAKARELLSVLGQEQDEDPPTPTPIRKGDDA